MGTHLGDAIVFNFTASFSCGLLPVCGSGLSKSQPLALCTGQALHTSQCRQADFFSRSFEDPAHLDRNIEIVRSPTWESG